MPCNLPLLDPFSPSLRIFQKRRPTLAEIEKQGGGDWVNDRLLTKIDNAAEAAKYAARYSDNHEVRIHIDDFLNRSCAYDCWRKAMPRVTPNELKRYQEEPSECDMSEVNREIIQYGGKLSIGQYLFRGGGYLTGLRTTRKPLSTSLCPQVAFSHINRYNRGGYEGRLNLWVIKVESPALKAFVYKFKGTKLGHEKEVLLQSKVRLLLKSQKLISWHQISSDTKPINVPVYLKEVSIFL